MILILKELKSLELPFNCFQSLSKKDKFKEHSPERQDADSLTNSQGAMNQSLTSSTLLIEDIKYLIEIQSDNPFLKGKKGHLIYMFPLLTKLIMSNEAEIKQTLQELFQEISREMNLPEL